MDADRFSYLFLDTHILYYEVICMNKPFRRLRKKCTKSIKYAGSKRGAWFLVRAGVCLLAFLVFAAIRMQGGELFIYAKKTALQFFGGAVQLSEAYNQSVDAFTRFYGQWMQTSPHD